MARAWVLRHLGWEQRRDREESFLGSSEFHTDFIITLLFSQRGLGPCISVVSNPLTSVGHT